MYTGAPSSRLPALLRAVRVSVDLTPWLEHTDGEVLKEAGSALVPCPVRLQMKHATVFLASSVLSLPTPSPKSHLANSRVNLSCAKVRQCKLAEAS